MPKTVMIVAHGNDAAAAREAAAAAVSQRKGITMDMVVPAFAPAIAPAEAARFDMVVIILSTPAVRNAAFVDHINAVARAARTVVPVRVDAMRPEWAGPDVDKYNCADFSMPPGPARVARWNDLFRLNVASYDDFNALRANAERWSRNGGGNDFLTQDPHRAGESARLVERMALDPFARPTEEMREYVARSVSYAAAARRRRIWSNVRVAVAVVLVAAFVAGTILFTRWANRRYIASMQSVSRFQMDSAPEFTTFRTIQVAESGVDAASALETIRDGLTHEWIIANIGVENAARNDYTGSGLFSDDGRRFVTQASGGVLRIWDVATAKPLKAWHVSQGSYDFSISADGNTAAVTGDGGLALVDLGNGSTNVIDAGTPVQSHIAIAADASRIMIDEGDHVAMWDRDDGLRASKVTGEVLDVGRTDDGLRALVRDGDTVHVIGERMDAAIGDLKLPDGDDEFVYGTIGADGTILVVDAGRLLVARHGGIADVLAPVGAATRDAPLGLAVAADGRVAAVSTSQDGVRLIDLGTGGDLDVVCGATTAVIYPEFSRNGLLACGNGLVSTIQSVGNLTPASAQPGRASVSNTVTPHAGADGTVDASVDGRMVTVTTPSGTAGATIPAQDGAIAVAALTPQGDAVAVGTTSGNVIAWDIVAADSAQPTLAQVRRWSAPDGDAVDRLGWSEDLSTFVAHTASGWWTPWSLHGTATLAGATAAAVARMPACWPSSSMAVFGGPFAKRHGLTGCTSAPVASEATGDNKAGA